MTSSATISRIQRSMHSAQPSKGILKKNIGSKLASAEVRDLHYHQPLQYASTVTTGIEHPDALVSDWYSHYPPVDGTKKTRVRFDDKRTVKVILVDGPMEKWPCYSYHDPHHIPVSENEYSAQDREMLNSRPFDQGSDGQPTCAIDVISGGEHFETALDDSPFLHQQDNFESSVDFDIERINITNAYDNETFSEQLHDLSEASSDTSSECGPETPPLGPISTFDVIDLKFASRSWDDMMDDIEDIELAAPVLENSAPKPSVSQITIFDGLGAGIKGRRWDEEDEDDLPTYAAPPTTTTAKIEIFDGRGDGIKGSRWDEDEENDITVAEPVTTASDPVASRIVIFDGLGTGIKGRRWDDDEEGEMIPGTAGPKIEKQPPRTVDIFDGLGTRLKGPSWDDLVVEEETTREREDAKRTKIPRKGSPRTKTSRRAVERQWR
ncbi:methyltransferase type 11 [Purpureocillium lavendulum]|uniref:Methyltransferase type 11 n=1 Tax=Purpureocillium lavendulum TaxID=1247861 RepID=A0AB34G5Y2_9HYPO|nr:methyltransferase type 11 [Purpureocillium lavendulum]